MSSSETNDAGNVNAHRRVLLESRLDAIEHARTTLSRDASRAPWLAFTLVATIPAGILGGRGAAAITVLITAFVTVVANYIVWAHRHEYDAERASISRQLAELDQLARGIAPPRAHWRTPGKRTRL